MKVWVVTKERMGHWEDSKIIAVFRSEKEAYNEVKKHDSFTHYWVAQEFKVE